MDDNSGVLRFGAEDHGSLVPCISLRLFFPEHRNDDQVDAVHKFAISSTSLGQPAGEFRQAIKDCMRSASRCRVRFVIPSFELPSRLACDDIVVGGMSLHLLEAN